MAYNFEWGGKERKSDSLFPFLRPDGEIMVVMSDNILYAYVVVKNTQIVYYVGMDYDKEYEIQDCIKQLKMELESVLIDEEAEEYLNACSPWM